MNCKTLPDALTLIVKRSGKDKLRNRSFVIACLKDLLPDQKSARNVLDAAFAMGVAEKFDEVCGKSVNKQQVALSQCAMQLRDNYGCEQSLVEDVLWAYGIALGFDAKPEPKSAPEQLPKPASCQAPNLQSTQLRPPDPRPFPQSSSLPTPQTFQPPALDPKPAKPDKLKKIGTTALKIIGVTVITTFEITEKITEIAWKIIKWIWGIKKEIWEIIKVVGVLYPIWYFFGQELLPIKLPERLGCVLLIPSLLLIFFLLPADEITRRGRSSSRSSSWGGSSRRSSRASSSARSKSSGWSLGGTSRKNSKTSSSALQNRPAVLRVAVQKERAVA